MAVPHWAQSIITNSIRIAANKPDIVLVDRSERRAILVDVTTPHDVDLVKTENDKLN